MLYGFGSGTLVNATRTQVAPNSNIEEIGIRTGVLFAILALAGLVGNPIGGVIDARGNGRFRGLKKFCGVMLMAGSTMCIFAKATLWGLK